MSYIIKIGDKINKALNHFSPLSHFYTPWKVHKTYGFLRFLGGIERWHWTKMGSSGTISVLSLQIILPYSSGKWSRTKFVSNLRLFQSLSLMFWLSKLFFGKKVQSALWETIGNCGSEVNGIITSK